jgi:hypothetical protein
MQKTKEIEMANIAEVINQVSTIKAIDLLYEAQNQQRRRLGLSQIGHKCKRYLWYKHKGYDESPIDGKTLRLFELGNILEEHIAKDLQAVGVIVSHRQQHVEFTLDGIALHGSIDGIVTGLIESNQPHLWEMKTMNDKGFAKLLKHGYEAYNDQYKAQVHAYMLGLNLKRAFVTVYNKNTSALYQERIPLNKDWIVDKLADVFEAIKMEREPERACPTPSWFEGRWCGFYSVCWRVNG